MGKSMQAEREHKRVAFVNGYDEKPKRRLFEMLQAQGMQFNQAITFLSDGGDTVRDLQFYLSPQAEHVLDWFHVTMRITNMKQVAKGLPVDDIFIARCHCRFGKHQMVSLAWQCLCHLAAA